MTTPLLELFPASLYPLEQPFVDSGFTLEFCLKPLESLETDVKGSRKREAVFAHGSSVGTMSRKHIGQMAHPYKSPERSRSHLPRGISIMVYP